MRRCNPNANLRKMFAATASLVAILLSPALTAHTDQQPSTPDLRQRCNQLVDAKPNAEPLAFRVTEAVFREASTDSSDKRPLPAHCDIYGSFGEHKGALDQDYSIKFHLRLPLDWNGGLFFQGGGGLNGHVGDAIGGAGHSTPALMRGYAVVSQDSGHDARTNSDPQRGGEAAFGFDFEARKNYAHASIEQTHRAASALVKKLYDKPHQKSYFYGCSKGGQEGMIAAQRYPQLFDGIVAIAPGISLPKAAVAQAWDTQTFASLMPKDAGVHDLGKTFSDADLRLVSDAFLAACDQLDGIEDGMIQHFSACTNEKVYPALSARQCANKKRDDCLSLGQINALKKSFAGAKNSRGDALYAAFPFDAGVTDFGWRLWKLGNHEIPPLNVVLGMPALATLFSTPPRALDANPNKLLAYQLAYNVDVDAQAIFATDKNFPESAWQLMDATSANLDAYKARGGKLIIAHGVSDPVFSVNDSIAWWEAVNTRYEGKAQDFARLFPVPGMGHCQGGPATDQFDAFSALIDWVEKSQAPDRLVATAGATTPWPGRKRPLCAYPATLHYRTTDIDTHAEGFVCK